MKISHINFRQTKTDNGRTTTAIFIYTGPGDPVPPLKEAVALYVKHKGYHEFIDANMDNPWVRVVISGLNELDQTEFDPDIHHL
jgi:hypothetical protein